MASIGETVTARNESRSGVTATQTTTGWFGESIGVGIGIAGAPK